MNEAQLKTALRQAQSGDSRAFGRVYSQFAPRVFGLCHKILASRSAAEDATSEVFERAQQALGRYDLERPFDRWVLTIARRHCLNRLRRARTESRLFEDAPFEEASGGPWATPLAACQVREERDRLRRAIAALPDNYRVPLVLKYYEDLSYDEIAEELGLSRNHVAVLLHRGKRALRQAVQASEATEP